MDTLLALLAAGHRLRGVQPFELAPVLLAAILGSQEPVDAPVHTEVDRIVAIVDDDPILRSEIDRVVALGLVPREDSLDDTGYRRKVLDRLVEQRLRLHEVNRFGVPEVEGSELEEELAQIAADMGGEAELWRRLAAVGMTLAELREQVLVQLQVLSFVRERLGPRVFVDLEAIRAYYDTQLLPELKRRAGADGTVSIPRLEDVQEQIRGVLVEQRLNLEIEKWTEELRREADVIDLLERELQPLPPILEHQRPLGPEVRE